MRRGDDGPETPLCDSCLIEALAALPPAEREDAYAELFGSEPFASHED